MPRTRLLALPLSLALLFAGAACGDDDDTSADGLESSNDVDELDDLLDSEAFEDALDDEGVSRDCVELALKMQEAFGGFAAGTRDPAALDDAAEAFADLADDLPEIADELTTISEAIQSTAAGDFEAVATEEYSAASDTVTDHMSEICPTLG